MNRIVFLGSGGGGNLKFIYKYFENSNVKIVGIITDRDCGALDFGLIKNIPSYKMDFRRGYMASENKIISKLKGFDADIIITNIHKILSKSIVDEFEGKLINLHYSYLPAFGGVIGMVPVNEALNRNNQFIGVTCHFVSEKVDQGKTISQGIFNKNLVNDVYQSTFELGALTLLCGINKILSCNTTTETKFDNYFISPGMDGIDLEKCLLIINNLRNENTL